jgi:23S rRNA A1618 N6-methylase RlmF
MNDIDYWFEALSCSFDEGGIFHIWESLAKEQQKDIAKGMKGAHENYHMAFYQPPSSDRYNEIEREWKKKYKDLEDKFNKYQNNAETAVKKALKQYSDTQVTIGEYGEVFRHGGRTEQIQ